MTDACILHVSGTPRPKQSVRWVNGRAVSVAAARTRLKIWTAALKAAANAWRRAGNAPISGGALAVNIDLFFPTEKAERWGTAHTHVPDKDNCEKAVLDALKGIVFDDDCRVSGGGTWKRWARDPGAVIEIRWIGAHDSRDDDEDVGAAEL